MLLLDAAFPPPPAQLVADCRAVGAGAVAPYVYGGFVNYTSAHYDALRAASIHILPIVVPGNVPPTYGNLAQDLSSTGIQGGPVVVDIESLSYPPTAWVAGLPAAIPGVQWGRYGTTGDLGRYPALAFNWYSQWPYAPGVWSPIPTLPNGWDGWQYAHDVQINGSQYDVSVIRDDFFGGDDLNADQDRKLTELHAALVPSNDNASPPDYNNPNLHDLLDRLWNTVMTGAPGGPFQDTYLTEMRKEIDAIKAALPTGGGTEPPEPAEPKSIVLHIPAVPGDATGTIT